jgi:hypothetical protein
MTLIHIPDACKREWETEDGANRQAADIVGVSTDPSLDRGATGATP